MAVVEPGKLVGSVVSSLDAVPVAALVVVGLLDDGERVLQVDLADAASSVSELAGSVARGGVQAVVALVVDEDGASCGICVGDFEVLCRSLEAALASEGVTLAGSFVLDRMEVGGRWFSVEDRSRAGVVAAADMAVPVVPPGSRAEGEESVAVDLARVAQLAQILSGRGRKGGAVSVEVAVRTVVETMQHHAAGGILPDWQLAGAGAALMDQQVRAALLHLADTESAAAAQQFWLLLSRVLPLPFRAEALTLLAVTAFTRGECTLAGVAATAILADQPEHQLAVLLDRAHAASWDSGTVNQVRAAVAAETTT